MVHATSPPASASPSPAATTAAAAPAAVAAAAAPAAAAALKNPCVACQEREAVNLWIPCGHHGHCPGGSAGAGWLADSARKGCPCWQLRAPAVHVLHAASASNHAVVQLALCPATPSLSSPSAADCLPDSMPLPEKLAQFPKCLTCSTAAQYYIRWVRRYDSMPRQHHSISCCSGLLIRRVACCQHARKAAALVVVGCWDGCCFCDLA